MAKIFRPHQLKFEEDFIILKLFTDSYIDSLRALITESLLYSNLLSRVEQNILL